MGRPKKSRPSNLDETQGEGGNVKPVPTERYYGKRNVQFSIAERIRERVDPDIIIQHWELILQGHTPVWVPDARAKGGYRVVPDPNPLNPTPNLAQRNEAAKELANRGWGIPVQSIQIEATLRQQLNEGLPEHLLRNPNLKMLAGITKLYKEIKEADIIDADVVDESNPALQELGQDSAVLNENNPPEGNSSGS